MRSFSELETTNGAVTLAQFENIRTNEKPLLSRSQNRGRRGDQTCCFNTKPYLAIMASSTFVSLPKPLFAVFPVKTNTPALANNHNLLGIRRGCLRVKAVSTKWEPAKVVPQADRVLVRLEELAQTTTGGVLLPKAAVKFERYLTGEVVSVGSEVGQQVGPGKKVLFSDVSAYEVDLGTGARHCFCKESDLLALVE
ncbi:10 kDa chaperonin 1 [Hirschfeldia incana]|nr:10 kDa chaperonin 1 [Hirschfeldia incana]